MKKLVLLLALPVVVLGVGLKLIQPKDESLGLMPQDSIFEINYRDSSKNTLSDQVRTEGYFNYFANLSLYVKENRAEQIKYSASLNITSFDAHPQLAEDIKQINFLFTQGKDGLIETVNIEKGASNAKYTLVLNLLSNISHRLYKTDDFEVTQSLFEGESIAKYTELTNIIFGKRISFKYLNDKKWQVHGGGVIELDDDFYSKIETKFWKEASLHDSSDQRREVNFTMSRVDGDSFAPSPKVNTTYEKGDSLAGKLLKKRFKLAEMENLIWNRDVNLIKSEFMAENSDGQPWYEYMAYYYVNKDKRGELEVTFVENPEKRGDIMLALASIGDGDSQSRMINLLNDQDDTGKNNFLRYGVFVEEPTREALDAYIGYSNSSQEYSYTAQKILASMYNKYQGNEDYKQEVAVLINTLSNDNVKEQRHRYSVLGNLGSDQVVVELSSELKSKDEDVERLAIDSLRFNQGDKANEILQLKAKSANTAVRLSALEALRGDYFESAYEFYEGRMLTEGSKSNRIQLLKNIYAIRNTNDRYRELIYQESLDCAYSEICSVANKMITEY